VRYRGDGGCAHACAAGGRSRIETRNRLPGAPQSLGGGRAL
jgi:hypothetical protein